MKQHKILVYVLLSTDNKAYLKDKLKSRNVAIVFRDELDPREMETGTLSPNIIFGNPPAVFLQDAGDSLEWIQLESTGFDAYQHVRIQAPITNLHGYFAEPCAETVLAGILALYRKIDELVLLKQHKTWKGSGLRPSMRMLYQKKVICLGSGSIARAIGRLLTGFQCKFTYYGRPHPDVTLHDKAALFSALPDIDILINALPGTAETAGFVDGPLLDALSREAIVVNIGRGGTVDENALVRALQCRSIGGAVLDVYEKEPLPGDHPLWDCPNTMLTQHTGGGSGGEVKGKIDFFVANLSRMLEGKPLQNVVSLGKGY